MRPYPHSTSSEDSATRADQRPDRPAIDADDDKSALRTTPKLTSLSSRRRKIVDLVPKKEVIDDDILLRNPGSGSFNTALKSDDEKDTKDRVKGKEKKDDKKDPDKTEGPVLDAAAVERRLRLCDAHDLPLDFRHGLHGRTVSRLLLSSVYGGSTQSTVCDIAKRTQDRLGHNISRIVCPNVVWNPYVPREPLKAGLACSIKSSDATWLEPFPLVVGLGINSWLYMGHYLGIKALPLSIKEFDNQSEKTKQEWYTSIASKRWAENTRKKISFTKRFGRRPRAEELVDYKGPNPSMNEIIDAFGTGDECMGILCLKPVHYDETFQQRLVDRLLLQEQPQRRASQVANIPKDEPVSDLSDSDEKVPQVVQEGTQRRANKRPRGRPAKQVGKGKQVAKESTTDESVLDSGSDAEYVPRNKRRKLKG